MIGIGRRVYGLGAIGLGAAVLANGGFPTDWLPAPAHSLIFHGLAYASAVVLIAAGVALNWRRSAAFAALALAAVFAAGMLALEALPALEKPADWVGWQAIAESTAMTLGGVLAWALTSDVPEGRAAAIARVARVIFGACLLVFGASHFVYAKYTAALVPPWLPPSQLIWTYATGLAQIAAGLAMLSGVQARLAAVLLTVMYVGFGLLVHIPSVVRDPSNNANWTENAINLVLIGAAWTLADSLAGRRAERPAALA